MYCEYYDFTEKPFTVTPNPRFVFLSKNHQEAFAHLLYGIDNHAGFIELTGEVGTGKTTVIRTLFGQLNESRYTTALIFNPCLSATELLRSINREYGIPAEGLSNAGLLQELNGFLLREKAAGRTVALVIDEAQNLEPSVLEQIRLISNLETDTDKLIQIILAGQPELGALLEKRELRQLAQRITVRYHLTAMDSADTEAYVRHRLSVAGSGLMPHFTASALRRIFRYSGGTPRLINILCDRALLVAYSDGCREISGRIVGTAIREISRERRSPRNLRAWAAAICLSAAVLAPSVYMLQAKYQRRPLARTGAEAGSGGAGTVAMPVSIKKGLADLGEKDSFITSFNVLAEFWKSRPITIYQGANPAPELTQLARSRDLHVYELKGTPDVLSRIELPALLEFTVPGFPGRRYLALTGSEKGYLQVEPPLPSGSSYSAAELGIFWSGRAFVFWRNREEIPLLPSYGAKGPAIARLQGMLAEAGFYKGRKTAVYDAGTVAAVKAFQQIHGLADDGRVGEKTLFFLYRRHMNPHLSGAKGPKGDNSL